MNQNNHIKKKLISGQPVIGIWSIINSPIAVDIAAHAGVDFQILDMEHGVYDWFTLDNCIRAAESNQCSPIIRVPGLQPTVIQSCLDLGAHGIIVPQIKNHEEALSVIQASKFAPAGNRGFNPFTRAGSYNPALPLSSTKLNNAFGLTSIILENKSVFTELDNILKIPELELFYLGVYDLSIALGYQGNVDHPELLNLVLSTVDKIKRAGKFSGLMVKSPEEIEKFSKLGVNMMVYGVDTHIYHTAIKQRVDAFKKQTVAAHD